MGLPERIKEARRAKRWTREQLAVYAGVSASAIARAEQGRHVPRASTLIALARVLDVPAAELAAEAGISIDLMALEWRPNLGEPSQ